MPAQCRTRYLCVMNLWRVCDAFVASGSVQGTCRRAEKGSLASPWLLRFSGSSISPRARDFGPCRVLASECGVSVSECGVSVCDCCGSPLGLVLCEARAIGLLG